MEAKTPAGDYGRPPVAVQPLHGPVAGVAVWRPVGPRRARPLHGPHVGAVAPSSRFNCEPFEAGYLIRVGRPDQKNWWRNFTQPWPIELVRKGRRIRGSAVAVPGTTRQRPAHRGRLLRHSPRGGEAGGLPKMHKGERPTPEALQAAAATLVFVVVTPETSN